jgi:hypothetical protein
VGSPDASAGVPRDNFSVLYEGRVWAPADGIDTLSVVTDGRVDIQVDGKSVLTRTAAATRLAPAIGRESRPVGLKGNEFHDITVRYSHASGPPRLSVTCSGPGFKERLLEPGSHPDGI